MDNRNQGDRTAVHGQIKSMMTYKVLSLKWRPQSFQDVVGQNHITQTLINAFQQNRIAQGYIFAGPRGVGKTTMARILAMALNAEGGPRADFDKDSPISREIANGRSLDVLEIDGASNRGIEEIRNLREQIKFTPMHCSFKVIIIDEVHMLTNQAFNALLRTLEEPPAHGKFIFCTTDIHKVPATIISRCQRFDFNRISLHDITGRLEVILKAEEKNYDKESLVTIARKADGSMRDSLSLLDQAISYCGDEIKYDGVVQALGLITDDLYFEFTRCIRERDDTGMVEIVSQFSGFGVPASEVLVGLGEHIRNLIYAGIKDGGSLLEMNQEHKEKYTTESSSWDRRDLLRIGQLLSNVSAVIRRSEDPYLLLEMTALKLLELDASVSIDELLSGDYSEPEKRVSTIQKVSTPEVLKQDEKQTVESFPETTSRESKVSADAAPAPVLDSVEPEEEDAKTPLPTLSIESIHEHWPAIMEKIHLKKPSIGAVLEGCRPLKISGNIILIQAFGKSGFNLKMIEKGIAIVEEILAETLHQSLKIKFIQDGGVKPAANIADSNHEKTQPHPDDENTLNRIVELFDGEILH